MDKSVCYFGVDFAGRQIVEERENFGYRTEEEIQAELHKYMDPSNKENTEGLNPNAADLPRPLVSLIFGNISRIPLIIFLHKWQYNIYFYVRIIVCSCTIL